MTDTTSPLQPDPAEIAKGLTKAQRRTLLAGHVAYGRGYWPLYNSLREKGLVVNMLGNRLSPLGLAVRAIIEQEGSQCMATSPGSR